VHCGFAPPFLVLQTLWSADPGDVMCGFGAVLNLLGPIPLHLRAAHLGIQRNVPKRTPEIARIAAFAAMRLRFWHVNCSRAERK